MNVCVAANAYVREVVTLTANASTYHRCVFRSVGAEMADVDVEPKVELAVRMISHQVSHRCERIRVDLKDSADLRGCLWCGSVWMVRLVSMNIVDSIVVGIEAIVVEASDGIA